MSVGKIWTILKKDLGWKPYRPITVQMLNPNNMEARLAACQFWLTFPTSWFDQQVIWSDEKWFVLIKAPNKKNSVCWAPANPHNLVQCKKQGRKKVMAWSKMVDGKILPVFWFEGSVNGEVYLDMIKRTIWPSIKARSTRRRYWWYWGILSLSPPCDGVLEGKVW